MGPAPTIAMRLGMWCSISRRCNSVEAYAKRGGGDVKAIWGSGVVLGCGEVFGEGSGGAFWFGSEGWAAALSGLLFEL